jgi:hypothetical protein
MANRKPSDLAQLTATSASDNDRLLAYVPAEASAVNQSKTISLGNIRKKNNSHKKKQKNNIKNINTLQ